MPPLSLNLVSPYLARYGPLVCGVVRIGGRYAFFAGGQLDDGAHDSIEQAAVALATKVAREQSQASKESAR